MSTQEQSQIENSATTDQWNVVSDEGTNQSQQPSWTPEETVSKDEYKKLQAQYTQSRQELSEFKKTSELSEEDKVAVEFIKKNWFVTQDDLDNMSKKQSQDANLNDIIANNSDLKQHESAIKELTKSTWLAPEDVIEKYGFKAKDKLSRAKSQWDVKWSPADKAKDKHISEMSSAEYAKWRTAKWIWTRGTFW